MTKLIFTIAFILLLLGAGFYFGMLYKTTHPDIAGQPTPTPAESWEIPATVYNEESNKTGLGTPSKEEVQAIENYAKHITIYDTVLVNEPVPNLHKLTNKPVRKAPKVTTTVATFPLRFSREGASFQADITYRYSDQTFVVENPAFKPPKPKIVYKHRNIKFGSAFGLLVDSVGNYKLLLQPINFSLWKFEFYPTVMVDPEYQISYGGLIGLRW